VTDITSDNRAFAVEQRGIEFVPENERTMTPRQLGVFWGGSSLYPFNVLLGVIIYSLGMPLWLTILITVIGGALSYAPVALGSIAGARSGMPTHISLRATFGIDGERVNALLGWIVGILYEIINVAVGVFAAVAIFSELGWENSGKPGKAVALVIVYGLCIMLPLLGHATMMFVQKFFSIALGIASVLLFIALVRNIDLGARAGDALSGKATLQMALVAMGIAWAGGYSYMIVALDYPRYLPTRTPGKSIFWQVLLGSSMAAGFLGLVGAMMAAQTDLAFDPVANVKPIVPSAIFIIWILAAIGGSVSNNALTLYSAGLAAQAAGLPLKRWQATVVDGLIAIAGLIYVLFVDSGTFLANLNSYIVLAIAWIGPFGAVWLLDMWWRKWHVDPLHAHGGAGTPYAGIKGSRGAAWIAIIAGIVASLLTIASPKFNGPIAKSLGTDLSWVVGPIVAGAIYWVMGRKQVIAEAEGHAASAQVPGTAGLATAKVVD
jgi:nucleobase:cation symporter-1, NCS1 family